MKFNMYASRSQLKKEEQMYAIVEIAGQQFKVEEGRKIFVHRLEAEKDTVVEFNRVLLVEDNDKVLVGEPVIENFVVEGKVLDHVKGDKVIVFKKKRRKGYRVKNGHRQLFSEIEITGIGEKGSLGKKETPKKEKVKKPVEPEAVSAEEKPQEKPKEKPQEKTEEKPKEKKATAKKTAAKAEPGEKKAAAKKPAEKKAPKKKE